MSNANINEKHNLIMNVCFQNSDRSLTVRHFQLHQWPNDEQVPNTTAMLDLIDKVQVWQGEGNKGRVIVHCV